MRILIVSALLGLTAAACAPPPPGAVAPGSPPTATTIAAMLGPAPAPVAAAPPPTAVIPPAPAALGPPAEAPVPAVPVSSVDWVPLPRIWFEMFQGLYGPGPAGRLTLSNFTYDTARVQAVLTSGPACAAAADPAATADFLMPLNATRIIATPPGTDICWRREVPPPSPGGMAEPSTMPGWSGWSGWNRAYTASGRFIDGRL